LLQGIANINLKILGIKYGGPAKVQDIRLLVVFRFNIDVEYYKTKLNRTEYYYSDGETVLRKFILGNSKYSIFSWLITPCVMDLHEETNEFNYHHCLARLMIERAFGVLKERWQILNRVFMEDKSQHDRYTYIFLLSLAQSNGWQAKGF
jgi:hypothetical protein